MAHGHNVGLTWTSLQVTHLAHSLAFYKMLVIMKGIGLQYIRRITPQGLVQLGLKHSRVMHPLLLCLSFYV